MIRIIIKRFEQNYGEVIDEMQMLNAVNIAHKLIHHCVIQANHLVDATAGNGNDTIYFMQNSPDTAKIYAFDVQKEALQHTDQKLQSMNKGEKVKLILDSHANMDKYISDEIDAAIFNLGYLPGGNHEITTTAESTLQAVQVSIRLLRVGGVIAITAYPGHENGSREYRSLIDFLTKLPVRNYTVGCWSMMNHADTAPVVYLIEKVRS